jgi:hypothetical protein
MIPFRMNDCRPQIVVVFLVALALLLGGMRVPDFSGPHRPKASHRTVVEIQQKTVEKLKQLTDFPTMPSKVVVSSVAATVYLVFLQVIPPLYASPLSPPNSGRSPPAPAKQL